MGVTMRNYLVNFDKFCRPKNDRALGLDRELHDDYIIWQQLIVQNPSPG